MPRGNTSHKKGCTCRACNSKIPGKKLPVAVRLPEDAVTALDSLAKFGYSRAELLDASLAHTYEGIDEVDELKALVERYRDIKNRPF